MQLASHRSKLVPWHRREMQISQTSSNNGTQNGGYQVTQEARAKAKLEPHRVALSVLSHLCSCIVLCVPFLLSALFLSLFTARAKGKKRPRHKCTNSITRSWSFQPRSPFALVAVERDGGSTGSDLYQSLS